MCGNRFAWALLAVASISSSAATAGDWTGYMNVFSLDQSGSQGGYLWGSAWGVPDLKTVVVNGSGTGTSITNNVLELYPNYNTYNATDPYWSNGLGGGNKWMEANTYVQTTISGPTAVFSGTVNAFSLSSQYAAQAFIKVLDPQAGWSTTSYTSQPLTGQGNFSLTTDTAFFPGQVLQYGFSVSGVNANPANAATLGSLQVITEPSSGSVILINVGSGTTRTQAQAGYPSIQSAIVVTKAGAGTVVFDAANPYTAPTSIDAGTIRVSNTAGLTASPVTVKSGGTLAIAAAGATGLADVTVKTGGAMTLRSDIAQSVSVNSLAIDSVVSLTVDSGTMTNGYMNVFDVTTGAYDPTVSGPWAVPDLRADFTSGTSVTLAPCYVSDTSSFWYTPSGQPGATGNKIMEALVYGQADGTLAGKPVKFSGNVSNYTLLSGSGNWTVKAFVRDFAADYSSYNESVVPVSSTGDFSVTLDTANDPTRHVQWGLVTKGPDVWITDLPSKGTVVVNAVPTNAEGGTVDVGSGMVTVASGLSAASMVAAIVAGRGDGTWNGTAGITSSAAAASGGDRTVGWLDNGDGSVTFAFAAAGDTNLDWQIDIIDAANFLAGGKFDSGLPANWNEGDFTYDGTVDILDAASFLSNGLFDAGVYNPSASGGVAAVPEPSVWAAAVACGLGLTALRRRRVS
jgi:autotransporter-associated beta strand protein